MMNLAHFILVYSVISAFLVLITQARPTEGDFVLSSSGFSRDPFDNLPTCKTTKCPADRVCIAMGLNVYCAVRNGQSCTSDDVCEGKYYCNGRKVCDDSSIPKLGETCSGNNCAYGLYCDLKDSKCHRIGS